MDDPLVYRLKRWPDLPDALRKAAIFRALSVMSLRPVNRGWIARQAGMKRKQIEDLMHVLTAQDALRVIDTSAFAT